VLRFVVASVLAFGVLALLLPPEAARIHVRWGDTVTATERADLERRFGLREGESLEENTWRYALEDDSAANIRALVQDPAAADTHLIDRTNFRLTEPPPGALQRVVLPGLAFGAIASGLLLGVSVLQARRVVLPPRALSVVLGVAPVLLVIALIITMLLVYGSG
jgi:hypothetical protein